MSTAALWNVNVGDLDAQEAGSEVPRRRNSKSFDAVLNGEKEVAPDESVSGAGDHFSEAPNPQSQFQLAKAIDAMERRTRKSKRRTDEALEPFNRILEQNNTYRAHDTVSHLAHRVSEIETRLIDRFVSIDENPVRAALARLEARLETFGRQNSLAEAVALQHTFAQLPKSTTQADSLQRLEDKLDAILSVVRTRASASSSIALAASQNAPRRPDRRLGEAIDEIAQRQQALDVEDADPRAYRQVVLGRTGRSVAASRQTATADAASFAAIRSEISDLAKKVDGLSRGVAAKPSPAPQFDFELDLLRADIARMSDGVRALALRTNPNDALEAVDTLSRRIDTSADLFIAEATLQALVSAVEEARARLADNDNHQLVDKLARRLAVMGEKTSELEAKCVDLPLIAGIRRQAKEARNLIATVASRPLATESLKRIFDQLVGLLDAGQGAEANLAAPTEELKDFLAASASEPNFVKIATALDTLEKEFDEALAGAPPSGEDSKQSPRAQGEVEELLRDLSRKMDAAQSPGADHETLNALQAQIALLSSRFDSTDDGLAKLNALQRSMQDVFAHLEQTRASVETSAAEAAREVLRIAIQEGQAQRDGAPAPGLAKMQEIQDEAEERTRFALSAVQQTLTKVVDRLSSMEVEVAEARGLRKPHASPKIGPAALGELSLGTPSSMLDRGPVAAKDGKTLEKAVKPSVPAPTVKVAEADPQDAKADFIAAARRAAKAVQISVPVQEVKRAPAAKPESEARPFLLEESRDYIARHKKPVLLGLAALFVIIGTLSVAHRIGFNRIEANRTPVAPKVHVADAIRPPAVQQNNAVFPLTMAPAAKTATSGSGTAKPDTARSTTAALLPVFATRPPAPPPAPTIPAKLKAMADAGDAGAQYVLGTQYAEGRGISRDFKAAAGLYQKAAAKGIAPAQYRLAALYEKGLGVEKDKMKARGLYLQAAEAGNPRAMHNLAVLLADGDGKPDYEGAATWFRKAAQFGMEDSQYNLGILLARGLGVQQSLVQSYQWFAIAAAQDDPEAAKKRDEVATKLGTADLAVAKALAASFKPRPATVAATAVQPPPGGWDGAVAASPLNSARPKISSL